MTRYAKIENGTVEGIYLSDDSNFAESQGWISCGDDVKKNATYSDGVFTNPVRDESLSSEEMMERLRVTRNKLLSNSDWTQAIDSPLTESDKSAWQTYRQALRDITDTYTSLNDVVWPEKP